MSPRSPTCTNTRLNEHTRDTLNTYVEILYDWFDALEHTGVLWRTADAVDLVAYRNRMMKEPSSHTGRPYSVRTINHRVRGVLRFYEWMVRNDWLRGGSADVSERV